ncbi:MAG: aminopeptidase P family protein [Oscillospiraceae bacterium]|nr:aminopeptidase P family protein [Oscillospiraceae bacterium]
MTNHLKEIENALPQELDAILLTGEPNTFYATYFHAEAVALITRRGSFYFTDSRYIEAAERDIEGASIAMVDRGRNFSVLINEALEKTGAKTVGFEDDVMSVAEFESYRAALHCTLTPASAVMHRLRGTKDSEEVRRLTAAQRISERALADLLGELHEGMTEKQAAARLQYLMLYHGADKMSFDPIVASGANGSMPHAVPTDKKLQKGEFITMDFGCMYGGYCSDMTRTVALGQVSDEQRRVYDIVLQAQLAGIAAARAGITGRELDGAARKVIDDAGYGPYFGHSFGHSVGIEIHEAPNATPSNDQPMPAGVVVSAEPGIYLPGRFGVRIEDVIVLTEGGCVDLAEADKSLIVL